MTTINSIMTQRRGFLKLAAAFIGGMVITKYAEPIIQIANTHHDWIEDKGDYCIVRVPDFKTFAKEVIDKPVIFILGEKAVVHSLAVCGCVNVYAPKGGMVNDCHFDASRMATEQKRTIITAKGEGLVLSGLHLIAGPSNDERMGSRSRGILLQRQRNVFRDQEL